MTNLRTGNRDTICRIATNRTKNACGILAHNRDKVRERHTYIIFRVREGACEQKPLALIRRGVPMRAWNVLSSNLLTQSRASEKFPYG